MIETSMPWSPKANLSGAVLLIEHGWGGGVERQVRELEDHLAREGAPSLRLRPGPEPSTAMLLSGADDDLRHQETPWGREGTGRTLLGAGVSHVHVHSLAGYDLSRARATLLGLGAVGLKFDMTVHDYMPICPRVHMVDWGGTYCDSPSTDYCRVCLERDAGPFGVKDVVTWRSTFADILGGARRLFAPSDDVERRMRNRFPTHMPKVTIRPPTSEPWAFPQAARERASPLVVGLIGMIGVHKGARILEALAWDAVDRNLPLRFQVYGALQWPSLTQTPPPNLDVTGAFAENELNGLLNRAPCDLLLLPSVCPETFSYALDAAFTRGLPPVVFDMGAQAARVRRAGCGVVAARGLMFDPRRLNDLLLATDSTPCRPEPEPGRTWISAENYYDG